MNTMKSSALRCINPKLALRLQMSKWGSNLILILFYQLIIKYNGFCEIMRLWWWNDHFMSLNKSTAEAAHSFSILDLSADLFSTKTVSWRSRILESCPASKLSGTNTNSLVLVLRAESVGLSFFKITNSKNFFGKIAESILSPTLIGMALTPCSNKYLAWPTVKSS